MATIPAVDLNTLTPAERAGFAAWLVGITGDNLQTAIAVAGAESGYGADVLNEGSGASGVWQVLPSAHPTYDVEALRSDILYNAKAMFAISSGGRNWSPWEAYTNGMYRSHLGEANAAIESLKAKGLLDSELRGAATKGTTSTGQKILDAFAKISGLPFAAIQTPGAVIGDAVNDVKGAVSGINDAIGRSLSVVQWFTNARNLFRAAEFIVGGGLIFQGLAAIARSTETGQQVIKGVKAGAVTAATKNPAAGAAVAQGTA